MANIDPTEEQARHIIQCLKTAPVFPTTTYASALAAVLYNEGRLKPLKNAISGDSYKDNNLLSGAMQTIPGFEIYIDQLAAGTLGLALKRNQDRYGFNASVNQDAGGGSLMLQLARSGIGPLNMLAQIEGFVEAYRRLLTSDGIHGNSGITNYRAVLAFVDEYLTRRRASSIQGQVLAQEIWPEWDHHVQTTPEICEVSMDHITRKEWTQPIPNPGPSGPQIIKYQEDEHGAQLAECQASLRSFDMWINTNGELPCDERWAGPEKARRIHQKSEILRGAKGCFLAGTRVWTNDGENSIESLQEGDRILTRVGNHTREYGIRSDETVPLPTDNGQQMFFGFNDERPFFTANHVFFTTTGLRVLNPEAAKRENPWLEVGMLRVGHSLLRTQNGSEYERVEIHSMTSASLPCNEVYGVHLREGLRSYHANGYLVHLNYPEITIKSVASLLKTFSADKRVELLKHVEGLRPLFDRLGQGAVDQMIAKELSNLS